MYPALGLGVFPGILLVHWVYLFLFYFLNIILPYFLFLFVFLLLTIKIKLKKKIIVISATEGGWRLRIHPSVYQQHIPKS